MKKSKDGDNAASLVKQLGFDPNSKEGKKLAAKIEKQLGDGSSIQLSKIGGLVGRVYEAAEAGLTAQARFAEEHPGKSGGPSDPQYNDCSMTTCRIAFPGAMIGISGTGQGAPFGVQDADQLISSNGLKSVDRSDLRVGDIIRYADDHNTPTHFMTDIFTGDDGTTRAFSRSGVNGRFEIVPVDAFVGKPPNGYGSIRGISSKDTGFYRPPQ